MQLRWFVLALVVAGTLITGAIAARADDDIYTTLTGKITAILDNDEVLIESNRQRYKLDLPDGCKRLVLNGTLQVDRSVSAQGKLDRGDREMEVDVLSRGGRRICP